MGHTHEDIDACFGTLASWFTTEAQVLTPQEYKTKVEAKFGDTSAGRLKARVEDVFVVPDYEAFFKKDFDKDFGHTHKNEFTQLQWRFVAVDISDLFPCGAKVTYQKFSNEQVTIIEKKAKMLCTTPVGRLYGGISSSLLLTIINSSLNSYCYLLCACYYFYQDWSPRRSYPSAIQTLEPAGTGVSRASTCSSNCLVSA